MDPKSYYQNLKAVCSVIKNDMNRYYLGSLNERVLQALSVLSLEADRQMVLYNEYLSRNR